MRSSGLDTVSVTGNVLRDYLTDLFPILELGTSAKMLSIVLLLAGGGLFETGARRLRPPTSSNCRRRTTCAGTRWASSWLSCVDRGSGRKTSNAKAAVVADALKRWHGKLLAENKSPKRKPGLLDNRGSHFYLALYWADAMANQVKAPELAAKFAPAAALLAANEERILEELAVGPIHRRTSAATTRSTRPRRTRWRPSQAPTRSSTRSGTTVFIDDADPIARAA